MRTRPGYLRPVPIKLDFFGESRFQLVLRNKDVMAVADNGDLAEPERLEAYNEELAKRSKEEPDEEDANAKAR